MAWEGEEITTKMAREIVAKAKARKRKTKTARPVAPDKLRLRLVKVLEQYKEKWNPKARGELAQQLRAFADELEQPQQGRK